MSDEKRIEGCYWGHGCNQCGSCETHTKAAAHEAGYRKGIEATLRLTRTGRGGHQWIEPADVRALLPTPQPQAGEVPKGATEVEPGLYVFRDVKSAFDTAAPPAVAKGEGDMQQCRGCGDATRNDTDFCRACLEVL